MNEISELSVATRVDVDAFHLGENRAHVGILTDLDEILVLFAFGSVVVLVENADFNE